MAQTGGIARYGFAGMFWKSAPKENWPVDEEYLAAIEELWEEPFGDMRQELVFIGQGLDKEDIINRLNDCLLTEEEKVIACALSKIAGADFVKTSTGFSTGGATFDDVALMRKVVGNSVGVKASGGVKSFEDAQKMVECGASRIGTSSGVKLLN